MPPYIFKVFGFDHILSMIIILIIFVLLLKFNKIIGIPDNSKRFLVALSFFMISLDLSEDLVRVFTGFIQLRKIFLYSYVVSGFILLHII